MYKKYNAGVTFIELIMATALAIFLLTLFIKIYLETQRTYEHQQAMARIQENARTAILLLQDEITTAGYMGCGRLNEHFQILNHTSVDFTAMNSIQGYTQPSDMIVIRKAETDSAQVLAVKDNNVWASSTVPFNSEDYVLISDCARAEIAQINHVDRGSTQQKIDLNAKLQWDYKKDIRISPLSIKTFYVANSGRKNAAGDPIYSLFMKNALVNTSPMEMVEGIEKMQIRYGVLADRHLDYVPADQVKNASQILGMHIMFGVNSVEPVILHKQWNTYISLRERIP